MSELYEKYITFADELGQALIKWARPVGWESGPTSVCLNSFYIPNAN